METQDSEFQRRAQEYVKASQCGADGVRVNVEQRGKEEDNKVQASGEEDVVCIRLQEVPPGSGVWR